MHYACMLLWRELVLPYRDRIPGATVLEVGSFNVNGSIRPVFEGCTEHVGVDWRPGPCVDVVSLAHEMTFAHQFDFVVSASMLEHDPHWRLSLRRMTEMVKPEGLLVLSWGGAENTLHDLDCAPDGGFHALKVGLVLRELGRLGMFVHQLAYEEEFNEYPVAGGVGLVAAWTPIDNPNISPLHEADIAPDEEGLS